MAVPTSYISLEMSAALGSELWRKTSYPIAESDIRRWAIAVYYPETPPPIFIDPAAANASHNGRLVAPEDFNPFAWICVENTRLPPEPDRPEHQLGIAGPGLVFGLNGGQRVDYGAPMAPGDVITSVCRLVSYSERHGRLGRMLFTVSEETWTNQRDEMVKTLLATLIRY
jgi:hypothetical protein